MCVTDPQKIDQFLDRGVENWFPSKDFIRARLLEGKQLSMYLGIDPTGPSLHLGHMIPLRKLREFQDLGHKVILLVGDFTGMIGDPSDKSATRKRLTRKEVLANAKLYKKQASAILRFSGKNAAELKFNSKWLAKLSFEDVVELAAHFTVQQMMARDMFDRRLKEDKPISISEFMYPLMQGYDSVAMKVDGEIGGNDQTFNMLAGRTLIKEMLHKEKFVVAMKLLVDSTGKKMGKTEGNMITLGDSPEEMFGKVMSWTDGMIRNGFELLTKISLDAVDSKLKTDNPRDVKMWLAEEVVAEFFGRDKAEAASKSFVAMFQNHETPTDVPEFCVGKPVNLVDVLVEFKIVTSKSEARRVIDEGGVKVDGELIKAYDAIVKPGQLIQKGKRHFVKIV
ncbi:MAG: tyrosine--tRNA ligase [Patescibacteria group bacterium]